MNINQLIETVKNKINKNIPCDKIEIEYVGYKKNGLIHGDFVSYYPNGEVSIEGELDQSKYQGEWNYYDDDGSLNKTINYDDEGVAIDTIYHK